jgi:glycine/D-amino acid oxidase-like deaminating enzyme
MRLGTADVVVIGAGVIGAAVAHALVREKLSVLVVDRRGVGLEASGANVGLVTLFSGHSLDEPEPGPVFELTRLSADAYAGLAEETGVDVEYERCGGVMFAETEDRLRALRRAFEGYRRHGVAVEWLDAAGVKACEPALAADRVLGGVLCPLNGQLNPLLLCRALARGARERGARFVHGATVTGISCGEGRVRAVLTSQGDIGCARVVNAAGAWAAEVGRMAGVDVPVAPARGQIVLTEAVPRFIRRVVSGAEPSARQTRRGNVIIGSTVEDAGFDKGVTPRTVAEFAHGALRYFPRLAGLQVIRTWAGLRPATPDHRPIIEAARDPGGLVLATGHSRRGICYAAGTGRLVADLVMGRPAPLDLAAFSLGRFGAAGGAR